MDVLLTLLASAGCTFIMGIPVRDDIMLNYQTTSFHDALYARRVLGLRPAPEFEAWLAAHGRVQSRGHGVPLEPMVSRQDWPALLPGAPAVSDAAGPVIANPWQMLRRTRRRALRSGRAGVSLPTAPQLAFQLAHAQARDAVHLPLDVPCMRAGTARPSGSACSCCTAPPRARHVYLQRPDLGRRLDGPSVSCVAVLGGLAGGRCRADGRRVDLAIAVADGLSALAVHRQAAPLLSGLLPLAAGRAAAALAPVVLVVAGPGGRGRRDRRGARRPPGGGAARRAAGPQFARQPGCLLHLGARGRTAPTPSATASPTSARPDCHRRRPRNASPGCCAKRGHASCPAWP